MSSINPDNPQAHSDKGEVPIKLERYGDALKSFEKSLDLNPELEDALYLKAEP